MKFLIHVDNKSLSDIGGRIQDDKELNLCASLLSWQGITFTFVYHNDGFVLKQTSGRKRNFVIEFVDANNTNNNFSSFHQLYDFILKNGLFLAC